MTTIDRRYGVAEGVAVKAPCVCATTANITLAGTQTIDGVAVVADDRVLVKDQTTGSQNGIYDVSSGNWTRAKDFDGAYDIVQGTRVWVNSGSISANTEYVVTTSGTITIDSTSIAFSSLLTLLNAAPGNADYIVKTANATLSGERVATDAAPVSWDFATAGQAKIVVAAATATASGIVELATSAEAVTGTDTVRAVTPAALAAAIAGVSPALPRGYIDIGAMANGTDATNDINFAAGVCRDSTNAVNITCLAKVKQLDAAFAAGTNAGMRSASSLADTSWHFFAIAKADGTSDYLAHDAVDPTSVLPSGYLYFQRLFSIVRASATLLQLTQRGDHFEFKSPLRDINTATPGTSAITLTLATIPVGIVVQADLTVYQSGSGDVVYLSALTQTDLVPSASAAPLGTVGAAAAVPSMGPKRVWTNTSAQIRARANDGTPTLLGVTHGYYDPRGRNA